MIDSPGPVAESSSTRAERGTAWLVFGVLLLSYAYFFQGGGFNPNSRFALTRALVERHELSIDAYPHTGDWAEWEGHRYSNKAPGLPLLSAPVYAAVRGLAPDGTPVSRLAHAVNVAVNALPSALLGVLLFHVLGRLGAGNARARAACSLVFGLGTLALPYATAYYAHQPAAAAGFAAFAALLRARETGAQRWSALAGVAAGLAVLIESSAVLIAATLGGWLCADRRGRGLLASYVAGGLPATAALLGYNHTAFGHPLRFWFQHANPEIEARVDGRLFGAPSLTSLAGLLVSPWRGLLYTSPVLALAPFGWPALFRTHRGAALVCLGVSVSILLLVASFHGWYGGWTPGARYLIPALPFLFVPTAFGLVRWPWLGAGLALVSVLAMLAFAAVAVEIPHRVANPLLDFALPRLLAGEVSVNPQAVDELLPPESYGDAPVPANAHSSNWGETVWPNDARSLLPLLGAWAIAAVLLMRRRP